MVEVISLEDVKAAHGRFCQINTNNEAGVTATGANEHGKAVINVTITLPKEMGAFTPKDVGTVLYLIQQNDAKTKYDFPIRFTGDPKVITNKDGSTSVKFDVVTDVKIKSLPSEKDPTGGVLDEKGEKVRQQVIERIKLAVRSEQNNQEPNVTRVIHAAHDAHSHAQEAVTDIYINTRDFAAEEAKNRLQLAAPINYRDNRHFPAALALLDAAGEYKVTVLLPIAEQYVDRLAGYNNQTVFEETVKHSIAEVGREQVKGSLQNIPPITTYFESEYKNKPDDKFTKFERSRYENFLGDRARLERLKITETPTINEFYSKYANYFTDFTLEQKREYITYSNNETIRIMQESTKALIKENKPFVGLTLTEYGVGFVSPKYPENDPDFPPVSVLNLSNIDEYEREYLGDRTGKESAKYLKEILPETTAGKTMLLQEGQVYLPVSVMQEMVENAREAYQKELAKRAARPIIQDRPPDRREEPQQDQQKPHRQQFQR